MGDYLTASNNKLSLGIKNAYGFGSAAYGIKDHGFNYFLLLFYSQVMGMDARLVGVAITIALVLDAISDPLIGYWSDNFRSRLGRRHPFMYASAAPVAISYYFLWNPPQGISQTQLFWYLTILSICIRTFITLYETPSTALNPELTSDYNERSNLMSFRYFYGWMSGTSMGILMFFFVFPMTSTEATGDGRFNPDSYGIYGAITAGLLLISILVSAGATHSRIPTLRAPPAQQALSLRTIASQMMETLGNRSFTALFVSALLGSIATGLAGSLSLYFLTYFWEFTSLQTGLYMVGALVSAMLALIITPWVSLRLGKKKGAIVVGLLACFGTPLPIVLRLVDLLPDNGSLELVVLVLGWGVMDITLIIAFGILFSSMIADLVEHAELKTGRRSEGLLFSATTFIRKSVQGLGMLLASFILHWADIKGDVGESDVSAESLWTLGALFVPCSIVLWLSMIVVISGYSIDRGTHEANLRKLAANAK